MNRCSSLLAVGITVLGVFSAADGQNLARRTVFPQMAVGGGWFSDFHINNQGFTPIQGIKISFFDDRGAPLVVHLPDSTSASSFNMDLGPIQTRIIKVSAPGTTVSAGYAELVAPYRASIRATLFVRFSLNGTVQTQLGVPEQWPSNHFSFAAESDQANGVSTGVAFANHTFGLPGARAQDLLITVRNENGSTREQRKWTLEAGEHLSIFLQELFPGLTDYRGTVSISGADPFGLLALRLEGTALGATAINEGPQLASYFLTQIPVGEVEGNDNRASAQSLTLPTVISGVIAAQPDQDYFSFTGKKGDVVNILVETASLPAESLLDAEVYLFDSSDRIVSSNDQNGVDGLPVHDAFIRTTLPADGTYFVRVWDFWREGGSDFSYKMHVTIDP